MSDIVLEGGGELDDVGEREADLMRPSDAMRRNCANVMRLPAPGSRLYRHTATAHQERQWSML